MRKLLLSAILATTALTVEPATASLVFDSVGDTTGTVYFDGIVEGNVQPGLTAQLNLTLTALNTATGLFTFSYDLFNSSSSPITASRVSGFGFNTTPDAELTGHSVTGEFDTVTRNGNVPQLGTFEICLSDVNCAGGASGGPTIGQHGTGTLTLNFADGTSSITMDDFYVRYQSITGSSFGDSGSGNDIPPPVIPEPASWMMMLAGFGALGSVIRRRRSVAVNFA